jgi:hypothetical protein
MRIPMKLAVIRKNHGFYTMADENFSPIDITRHPAVYRKGDKGLSKNELCFWFLFCFKCSLYVLVMFCKKCDDSQITEYFNLSAPLTHPVGENNNNKGGK